MTLNQRQLSDSLGAFDGRDSFLHPSKAKIVVHVDNSSGFNLDVTKITESYPESEDS